MQIFNFHNIKIKNTEIFIGYKVEDRRKNGSIFG